MVPLCRDRLWHMVWTAPEPDFTEVWAYGTWVEGIWDIRHMHVDGVSEGRFWRSLTTKGRDLSQEVIEITGVSEPCLLASGSFSGIYAGRPFCLRCVHQRASFANRSLET